MAYKGTPNIITDFGTIYLDEKGFVDSYGTVKEKDYRIIDDLVVRVDLKAIKKQRYKHKLIAWDNLDDEDFNLNEIPYWNGKGVYIKPNKRTLKKS